MRRLSLKHHFSSPSMVVLYSNEKVKSNYFRVITFVSGLQLVLWTYLSYFALFELNSDTTATSKTKPTTSTDDNSTQFPSSSPPTSSSSSYSENFIKRISSAKWRVILSLLSLGAGLFFATTACMYPLRIVQKLTYVGNSQQLLKFVTYTPLGSTRTLSVAVGNVACVTSEERRSRLTHLAVKVKGYPLFFLLDQQGTQLNPQFHLIVSKSL